MKRLACLSTVALLGLSTTAWAWPIPCWNAGIHCICPPPPPCPDCCGPCERRLHFCSCHRSDHARKLIDQLGSDCCCDRIRAAEKLGSRLHADFCCDPEVLSALVHALQCDACWEVRRAAAWGIARQKARTELGVLALSLAARLDPHFLVRDAATDALAVLLVCRRECFKDVFARADELAKVLRGKYKPGSPDCLSLLDGCLPGAPTPAAPVQPPAAKPPAEKKAGGTATPAPSEAATLQNADLLPPPPGSEPKDK